MKKKPSIDDSIQLSEGSIEGFHDLLNIFLEYFVFFRWIYFKNRPRGNLLLLRSCLVVGTYSAIYYYFFGSFSLVLEGIEVDSIICFAGAIVFGYSNMLGVFHRKSDSCTKLYVQMVSLSTTGNKSAAELLSSTLCLQLLTLDLWAHRMFRRVFSNYLHLAIKFTYTNSPELISHHNLPEKIEDAIKMVNSGKLQAKVARMFLDNYQGHLLEESKVYKAVA
ncbi:MAG: hypothetical protein A4S09_15345 [Proteobacteria bacterium SG_bin7]|nr:MAG: hypothetical protein A4S09_15345 [Proteobacteria bacterium SG_bin7]